MCIVHTPYLLIQNCGRIVYTYVALLYFAWADQRVQQFYNYHNVSSW